MIISNNERRFFIVSLFILWTFLGGTIDNCLAQEFQYPEWIYDEPEMAHIVAFQADKNYYSDALRRISAFQKIRVFGKVYYFQRGNFTEKRDSILLEPLGFGADSLVAIDKFRIDGDTMALMVVDLNMKPRHFTRMLPDSTRPEWVIRPPRKENQIFGIGRHKIRRLRHAASFAAADENALIDCAMSVKFTMQLLHRDVELDYYGDFEKIQTESLDVQLVNIQILKRWIDRESNMVFSLASCQVADEIEKTNLDSVKIETLLPEAVNLEVITKDSEK